MNHKGRRCYKLIIAESFGRYSSHLISSQQVLLQPGVVVRDAGVDAGVAGLAALVPEGDHADLRPAPVHLQHQRPAGVALEEFIIFYLNIIL